MMPAEMSVLLDMTSFECQVEIEIQVLSGCKGHYFSECMLVCGGPICTVSAIVLDFLSHLWPCLCVPYIGFHPFFETDLYVFEDDGIDGSYMLLFLPLHTFVSLL